MSQLVLSKSTDASSRYVSVSFESSVTIFLRSGLGFNHTVAAVHHPDSVLSFLGKVRDLLLHLFDFGCLCHHQLLLGLHHLPAARHHLHHVRDQCPAFPHLFLLLLQLQLQQFILIFFLFQIILPDKKLLFKSLNSVCAQKLDSLIKKVAVTSHVYLHISMP